MSMRGNIEQKLHELLNEFAKHYGSNSHPIRLVVPKRFMDQVLTDYVLNSSPYKLNPKPGDRLVFYHANGQLEICEDSEETPKTNTYFLGGKL